MKGPWLRRAHLFSRLIGWVAGIVVITGAVLMALSQLLLPTLADHPQWIAGQLSRLLQQPVAFESMEGHTQPAGPLFVMHGVTVGGGNGSAPMRIPEAELKIDFGGWVLPSRHLINLRARGLRLDLSREADSTWHINGISLEGGPEQSFDLDQLPSIGLWLHDIKLDITDNLRHHHFTVVAEQLRVSRQGKRIRVGARMHRAGALGEFRGAGNFSDDGADGRLWIGGDGLDFHALTAGVDMDGYTAESGHGSFQAWLDWKDAKVVRSLARFDLEKLAVAAPDGARAVVDKFAGLVEVTVHDGGKSVRWAGADGSVLVANLQTQGDALAGVDASVSHLELSSLLPWLALKPQLPLPVAQWLGEGRPHGDITHAALRWNHADGLTLLEVGFAGLGISPLDKLPGVDGLQGELRGDSEALSLTLPAQTVVVNAPHTFRQPLKLTPLRGKLAFWHEDDAWYVGADALHFSGDGYAGEVRGDVVLPDAGGKPFVDLYALLDHVDAHAARQLLPIDALPPGTLSWLDNALIDGRIVNGNVLLHGNVGDWPFHDNVGRFEARGELADFVLAYGKSWPQVTGISAVVSFVNDSMKVEGTAGDSLGNHIDHAMVTIPEMAHGVLDVVLNGNGTGSSLLDLSRNSPIAMHEADLLSKMKLGGTGKFDFHLSLPLTKAEMHNFTLDGHLQMQDADLTAPEWGLKLDKLTGPATFDRAGFHAGPLNAGFHGQPSVLDMAIGHAVKQSGGVFSARLQGRYRMNELTQGYKQLEWLNPLAGGRADFTVGLDIFHADSTTALTQRLSVDSNLNGMSLAFPVPMKKDPDSSLPLHVEVNLPINGSDVLLSVGQVMRARLHLPDNEHKPLAATFNFGTRMPDDVPGSGLRIRGRASKLDVTGWVQYAASGGTGGPSLESIDVSTDQALVFNHLFPTMHIVATPQSDALVVDVDSAGLTGRFIVPSADIGKRGIIARLQRLYWPKELTPKKGGEASSAPEVAVAATNPADTGITPSALPPFHLWVSDLRFGDSKLGEGRLETWPTDSGLHVDQLRSLSGGVQINGSGDWNGSATDSHSHMAIDFAADNLGEMLDAFGFAGMVAGGKVHAHLDATWPGPPSAIDLATMDGKLGINVTDGSMPEVPPGVARIFGLVSVLDLPRRLLFNFGDVFGKGFAFDLVKGDYLLGDGNARTSNMQIKSPAAEISIKGRTGLRARDYDLRVVAEPHAGNSLPIAGAVVGGPIGAAAGLVVQGLFGHGINKAAAEHLVITGSWDKPVITPADKAPVLAPPAASSPVPMLPAPMVPAPATRPTTPAPASSVH